MIAQDQLNIKKINNKYRIIMKKKVLCLFNKWVDVTWKNENGIEEPIEFDTFHKAKEFIFMVIP